MLCCSLPCTGEVFVPGDTNLQNVGTYLSLSCLYESDIDSFYCQWDNEALTMQCIFVCFSSCYMYANWFTLIVIVCFWDCWQCTFLVDIAKKHQMSGWVGVHHYQGECVSRQQLNALLTIIHGRYLYLTRYRYKQRFSLLYLCILYHWASSTECWAQFVCHSGFFAEGTHICQFTIYVSIILI